MDDLKTLIPVSYDNPERPTVSGRELHEFLEVKSKYADWFKNMSAYLDSLKTSIMCRFLKI